MLRFIRDEALLLGIYLGRESVGSAYGAAGSLVVLLLWIYWSASILFFGAEFTQVYTRKHGSMKSPVEDRRPRLSGQPGAAILHGKPVRATGSGGAIQLAAGGVVGLLVGALLGGLGVSLVFVKSLKKLFT